jgi:hypothetical protein
VLALDNATLLPWNGFCLGRCLLKAGPTLKFSTRIDKFNAVKTLPALQRLNRNHRLEVTFEPKRVLRLYSIRLGLEPKAGIEPAT